MDSRKSAVAQRVGVFLVKALILVVLSGFFILPFLGWLPDPAAFAVWVVIVLAAAAVPWSAFWRREFARGRLLRAERSRRLAPAALVALAGYGITLASDFWFAHRYSDQFGSRVGPVSDLVLAAPFALIVLLLAVTAMTRIAGAIAAVGLAAIVVDAFYSFDSSDSSTAAIALFGPWVVGIPFILVVYAVDAFVRGAVHWRDWPRAPRSS